jgi:non-homologous end joining protein Ku
MSFGLVNIPAKVYLAVEDKEFSNYAQMDIEFSTKGGAL